MLLRTKDIFYGQQTIFHFTLFEITSSKNVWKLCICSHNQFSSIYRITNNMKTCLALVQKSFMIHDEKLKQHDNQPKKFHHPRKRVTEIIVYNFFWYVYVWRYNAPCWYKVNWFRMNIKLSACVLYVCVCVIIIIILHMKLKLSCISRFLCATW